MFVKQNRFLAIALLVLTAMFLATPVQADEFRASPAVSVNLPALQEQLAQLQSDREDLETQYQALSGSQLLHRVLQEQRMALPHIELQNFQNLLAELRLEMFYVQRELRVATEMAEANSLRIREQQLQEHIDLLVEYTRVQQQLLQEINAFSLELEEYLFWTPSNQAMNLAWWRSVPALFVAQQQRMREAVGTMLQFANIKLNNIGIGLLLLLALAIWQRPKLKRNLAERQLAVANNSMPCSSWGIFQSLAKLIVVMAPASLVLLVIGQLIGSDGAEQHLHLTSVFTALAFAWFMVSFLAKLMQPGGFAETYFLWDAEACVAFRRFILLLAIALLPLTFVLAFASQQNSLFALDAVGPLSLLVAALYISGITLRLFRQLPQLSNSRFVHQLIFAFVLLLPLSLVWMVASGYYYTALQLSGYYLATFYVLTIWVIAEASIRNSILFSSMRLKQQRDIELEGLSADNGFTVTDIEDVSQPEAPPQDCEDIEKAEEQSLRLSRFFLMLVFGFILFAVWSEAFHAFDYLNQQYVLDSEQGTNSIPVSIGGLLSAIFILVFSVVLIRNLPGLLEVLVLSRLKLEMGTAYAITSLTNYVLVSIAVVTVLGILGVKWEQLQWLAAGLTVGLGFGLQEIFGNFISGLILFFERPVRVGDIVTLNNLSGRVTKIKIRATVITDFDRRDIVVPNRSFITGQFVNWSLSNTITRLTVKVGVAYGSDLEKTRDILLDIAEKEPRVLADPPPQVLFLAFGNSTLDHELRIHVGALADRNPAIDAVNREIDKRFKEAGIEIAFNQIDVHFRNELGIEKEVQSVTKPTSKGKK